MFFLLLQYRINHLVILQIYLVTPRLGTIGLG